MTDVKTNTKRRVIRWSGGGEGRKAAWGGVKRCSLLWRTPWVALRERWASSVNVSGGNHRPDRLYVYRRDRYGSLAIVASSLRQPPAR